MRGVTKPEISSTLLSHWVSYIHTKWTMTRTRGSSVGTLLTHKISVYVRSRCPFLHKGTVGHTQYLSVQPKVCFKAKACSLHVPVSLTPFKFNVQIYSSFLNQAFGSSNTQCPNFSTFIYLNWPPSIRATILLGKEILISF